MFGSVIDDQCSLADLQELEEGQLKLVEGNAREDGRNVGGRKGQERGCHIPVSAMCITRSFFQQQSHHQTLSTYIIAILSPLSSPIIGAKPRLSRLPGASVRIYQTVL